jgi:hypothetical protein
MQKANFTVFNQERTKRLEWNISYSFDPPIVKVEDFSESPVTLKKSTGVKTGCSSCSKTATVIWLNLRWHGKPWPKRFKLRKYWFPIYIEKLPGCGCLVKVKALFDSIKLAYQIFKKA